MKTCRMKQAKVRHLVLVDDGYIDLKRFDLKIKGESASVVETVAAFFK